MKGISLPINMVVTISIVVLVLIMVGAFFLYGSSERFDVLNAEKIFNQGCDAYCTNKCTSPVLLRGCSGSTDPLCTKFVDACITLGYNEAGNRDNSYKCLDACGPSCSLDDCNARPPPAPPL